MGFFGLGGGKNKDDGNNAVQRSVNSVALAKKRMNKTKSQRDAEDAEWEAENAELARMEEEPMEAPASSVSTYNPGASPSRPAVKNAMKKHSKFADPPQSGARPPPTVHAGREQVLARCSVRPCVARGSSFEHQSHVFGENRGPACGSQPCSTIFRLASQLSLWALMEAGVRAAASA